MRRLLVLLIIGGCLGSLPVRAQQVTGPQIIGRGTIMDAAWLPDDQTLVAGGTRGLWLYDGNAPQSAPRLVESPYGAVERILVGGNTLVMGHRNGIISLWKAATPLTLLDRLPATGKLLAMSRDGQRIVTLSDGAIAIWDVAAFKQILTIAGADASFNVINDAALSDNGRWFTFVPEAQTCDSTFTPPLQVWDLDHNKQIGELKDQEFYYPQLAISPDGQSVAYIKNAGLQVWTVGAAKPIQITVDQPDIIPQSPAFSADGKSIITFEIGAGIESWDIASKKVTTLVPLPAEPAQPVYFFRVSKSHVFGIDLSSQIMAIWSASAGAPSTLTADKSILQMLEFTKGAAPQIVWRRDFDSLIEKQDGKSIPVEEGLYTLISPDGRWLVYRDGNNGNLLLRDLASGRDVPWLSGPYSSNAVFFKLAFSPDSRLLAVPLVSGNGVDVWDLTAGKRIQRLDTPNTVSIVALSGSYLAAGLRDSVMIWDLKTWRGRALELPEPTGDIDMNFLFFSGLVLSDDRLLALTNPYPANEPCYAQVAQAESGSNTLAVVYSAAPTDSTFSVLDKLEYLPTTLVMNVKGSLAAIGDVGFKVHLIDPQTGKERTTLDSAQIPYLLAFDAAGSQLAAAGDGGIVEIWKDVDQVK